MSYVQGVCITLEQTELHHYLINTVDVKPFSTEYQYKAVTQNHAIPLSSSGNVFWIVFVALVEKRVEEDSARVTGISGNCDTLLLRVGSRLANVIWGQTQCSPTKSFICVG